MHLTGISKSDRIKINLATEITKRIAATNLSQRDVSKKIGLSRTKIVAMKNRQVDGISLEKMLTILEKLDERVAIVLGNDARETRVEYETNEERYLRLHGDGSVPMKYRNGFVVNLADGLSVEISGDPEEWENYELPFGSLAHDIVHRPENREIEKALRAIVCAALKSGDPQGPWSRHLEAFYIARAELKNARELTPRMEGILRNADSVLKSFARDITIHQRELAEFDRSRDRNDDIQLVTFDGFK
ncbi:XRE family transcriptional regulator [Ruegeria atlantica]|uniref:XRE family transcriptional regulator n=1 Tax=Ruegeria atlantica TaxID=81569 RepID=UPI002495862C|nr:XRE family transcriptional regulator [Ruegeria atlantica]